MSDAPAPLAAAQVRRRVLALMPAIFLGAIDQSIVSVALLTIGHALGDLTLIAWVMSGYLVAGTVATPLYGKLSDLHGRRRMLALALSVSMAGSTLAALSVSMPMLIAARVLQGLGSGTLFALSQAAAADFISGPERARWQGYFSGVFACAALAAPLAGGYLTEHLSWRAVFWINLPLAALALWALMTAIPPSRRAVRAGRIDGWGAALLTAGIGTVLIALTRVGQGAGWLGASTLALGALGAALLAAWAWREVDAPEPIVPLVLFRDRRIRACCLVNVCCFFVLVGCTVLLPLWMQTVGNARTDEVARRLVALTLAVPAGALAAGRAMLRTPHLGALVACGCALAALGLAGLAWVRPTASSGITALMLPLGAGVGMTLPSVLVAAQMSVGPAMVGVVTGVVAFFRSLGGVIGIAVLTSMVLAGAGGGAITEADPRALERAFSAAFATAAGVATLATAIALRIGSFSRAAARGGSDGARS
ncbi:MAG TPA: MFS transporter [Burkholderiaceae bacterium]|nr:MFS transporter [Burkholderiaceae bacterium]